MIVLHLSLDGFLDCARRLAMSSLEYHARRRTIELPMQDPSEKRQPPISAKKTPAMDDNCFTPCLDML